MRSPALRGLAVQQRTWLPAASWLPLAADFARPLPACCGRWTSSRAAAASIDFRSRRDSSRSTFNARSDFDRTERVGFNVSAQLHGSTLKGMSTQDGALGSKRPASSQAVSQRLRNNHEAWVLKSLFSIRRTASSSDWWGTNAVSSNGCAAVTLRLLAECYSSA